MIMKWCFVLCGLLLGANASINIPYHDVGLSVCVKNILTSIVEFQNFNVDVSLIDIENIVVQNIQEIKGLRFITRTQSWANNEIYNTIYVMNYHDYNDLKNGFNVIMNDNYWTPFSKFIIILDPVEGLDKIRSFLILNNIYNVTILRRVENEYLIYSFSSPIQACNHSPHLIRITQCSDYNGRSYIFPMISEFNLRGCRFKFAARNVFPMINFDNNKSEGWEQQLMLMFGDRHNMVIELVEYSKIDSLGRVSVNYTYMLNKVRAGEMDGAIGGYYINGQGRRKLSYGYPIIIDHVVIIVPKAELYDMWQAFYYTSFYVILLVFSLIIIFSLLAYLLVLFPSRETDPIRDFMIVFGYFLNEITVNKLKKGFAETLIISSLLFTVFIIPYSIQALIVSVKTNPIRGYEAKTYEEVSDKYHKLVPYSWEANNFTLNSKGCNSRLACLELVMNSNNKLQFTLLSELLYDVYKWMANDYRCDLTVYKVRDYMTSMMRTVYFQHGSLLVLPFNKFLFQLSESGLLKKHYDHFIINEHLKCKFKAEPAHSPLRLQDLKQPFAILIGGYCLSAVCFTYEVFAKRYLFPT